MAACSLTVAGCLMLVQSAFSKKSSYSRNGEQGSNNQHDIGQLVTTASHFIITFIHHAMIIIMISIKNIMNMKHNFILSTMTNIIIIKQE